MKINLVTLCSGIEAQGQALRRLCRDYPQLKWELLAWSEIDKNAIAGHNAIFPEYADRNLGDMTTADYSKVTEPVDVLFYSTPCQSVSVAGRNKGMKEGDDAASALIWHTRRAIETLKPKIAILENVKGMTMGKNLKEFHKWQHVMESYGYTNFSAVLNSRDFLIPQNRERLFMVSIWGKHSYNFPKKMPLEKRIKDILEPYGTVDESFYFSAKQLARVIAHCDNKVAEGCGFKNNFVTLDEVSGCVTSRYSQRETDTYIKEDVEPVLCQRLSLYENNAQAGRVYDIEGISPTVKCYTGGNSEVKILEPFIVGYTRDKKGKIVNYHPKYISNTIHTSTGSGGNTDQLVQEPATDIAIESTPSKAVLTDEDGRGYLWQDGRYWRVRKLTPMEVGRLMDMADEDIQKMIDAGISKTALYSLFGNSIVVSVLYWIFYKLFVDVANEDSQLSLFDL